MLKFLIKTMINPIPYTMKKTLIFAVLTLLSFSLRAQSLADLFETNKRSVLTVYVAESVTEGTGDPRTFTDNMGMGSGVLIKDNVVLTASHVVANAEKIMVQFYDGETVARALLTERSSRFFGIEAMVLPYEMTQILNDVNSTVTHTIKVLRAGQIVDLRWISKDFEPTVR